MGCLFTIPLLIIFFLLFFSSAIFRILKALFGWKQSSTGNWQETTKGYRQNTDNTQSDNTSYNNNTYSRHNKNHNGVRRKIFSDDEGEYVDFEEIKDNK